MVALARWDRLKDPVGIIRAFALHVENPRASLVVAGPVIDAVADDPEAGQVISEARAAWRRLPASRRDRIRLAALPMDDLETNALLVNALQRQAAVIVKKSLQEGFGFGVTEGMWKAKPVVATRVGGHRDQVVHGRTGLLVDDASDLTAFAAAIDRLLDDPALALELGGAARERSVRATSPIVTSSTGCGCSRSCRSAGARRRRRDRRMLYRVRWDEEHESVHFPAQGTTIIHRGSSRARQRR